MAMLMIDCTVMLPVGGRRPASKNNIVLSDLFIQYEHSESPSLAEMKENQKQ